MAQPGKYPAVSQRAAETRIAGDCLLELRLVQELRLRDLGDLVSYGLPQELRLRDLGNLVSYGLP